MLPRANRFGLHRLLCIWQAVELLDLQRFEDLGLLREGLLHNLLGGALLSVLQFLIKIAHVSNACLRLLLELKLEAHGYLLEFAAFESKRVLCRGLAVKPLEDVWLLKVRDGVVDHLGNTEVKRNDLGRRLARSDFDKIVHKEAALQHRVGFVVLALHGGRGAR